MTKRKKEKNFAVFYIETGEDVKMFKEDISGWLIESEQDAASIKTSDHPKEKMKAKSKKANSKESSENIGSSRSCD